jgi:hypothetical protein
MALTTWRERHVSKNEEEGEATVRRMYRYMFGEKRNEDNSSDILRKNSGVSLTMAMTPEIQKALPAGRGANRKTIAKKIPPRFPHAPTKPLYGPAWANCYYGLKCDTDHETVGVGVAMWDKGKIDTVGGWRW